MAPRNRVAEIAEIKSRGPQGTHALRWEIESLDAAWEEYLDGGATIDFFPIRAVTLLEVFSRAWIAQLIDHGPPYVERVADLKADIKFDLTLVRAIQGRAITLGDLIAHSVQLNSFGQVLTCFEALVGNSFIPAISVAVEGSRKNG